MADDQKVALVLGGIKGIGKGIGLDLIDNGVKVALTYHDWEEFLPETQRDFESIGNDHLILKINLLETEKIGSLVRQVLNHFGRLDILINNIERGGWPVVHGAYTRDQWDLEMATTLRAKQWVFDFALPYLKKSKDACVINLSSIAGIVGRSGPASFVFNEGYSAANRGISLLTETWARLGAPNVRVNEIMLGFIETRHGPKTRGWGLLTEDQKQAILDHTLLKRIGEIEDVVKVVRFILFDAPFLTGSVIRLDGGYVIGGAQVAPMPKGLEPEQHPKIG
ncbi:MAG: SDR family oxidoreductase [Desulfobacterales bacterium]|jgi:3-oxoacyl-[acyl-carrier protein] reductase|nr:SDR family oxidoreductase [Desulfobacterales bacterium]